MRIYSQNYLLYLLTQVITILFPANNIWEYIS